MTSGINFYCALGTMLGLVFFLLVVLVVVVVVVVVTVIVVIIAVLLLLAVHQNLTLRGKGLTISSNALLNT